MGKPGDIFLASDITEARNRVVKAKAEKIKKQAAANNKKAVRIKDLTNLVKNLKADVRAEKKARKIAEKLVERLRGKTRGMEDKRTTTGPRNLRKRQQVD